MMLWCDDLVQCCCVLVLMVLHILGCLILSHPPVVDLILLTSSCFSSVKLSTDLCSLSLPNFEKNLAHIL
jgi:hypothetical protein